jgi:hypothetical protein
MRATGWKKLCPLHLVREDFCHHSYKKIFWALIRATANDVRVNSNRLKEYHEDQAQRA